MPKKTEREFLRELEGRAQEGKRLLQTEMMPQWAKGLGDWLVVNPWRVLVPLSVIIYGLWRGVDGVTGRELILGLFGGVP